MLTHRNFTPQPFGFRAPLLLGLVIAWITFLPALLPAQSPLTIQPSTGRVGVGTTNPAYPLDVSGTVNATAFRGDGSQITGLPAGSGGGQWTTNGTNIYYNGGNVGVGTTNPTGKLEVESQTTGVQVRKDGVAVAILEELTYDPGFREGSLQLYSAGSLTTRLRANGASFINSGNVGIGTTSPTSRLHVIGDITATGAKNFQIDHPLEPDKKLLVHSALEGPEVAVYYRGEAQLVNGEMEITLPSYFEALTRKEQRTVQLTPIKGWSPLYVVDDIQDGKFTVRAASEGNPAQRFYWEVKAVRADVLVLVVEKTKDTESMKVAENTK